MECLFCDGRLLPGSPYFTCASCGAKSLYPIPTEEELRAYYNGTYEVPQIEKWIAASAIKTLTRLAESKVSGNKLLEIGCSYGFFLKQARMQGWNVSGIELSQKASASARNELSLDVHTGTLKDARLSPPYDVIVSFNVIEHLIDPLQFLAQCKSLLRDNGILMFSTANVSSWIANAAGEYWTWYCPPAHVYLFTPEALKAAISQSSLCLEHLWTRRGDANSNLYEYIAAMFRRWCHKNGSNRSGVSAPLAHRPAIKLVRAMVDIAYFPLAIVLDPWLAKRNLQPELVAIIRKQPTL